MSHKSETGPGRGRGRGEPGRGESGHGEAEPLLLSRPLSAFDVPAKGLDVTIEANETERDAIATALSLEGLHRLAGTYHVTGSAQRLRVTGRVNAAMRQICVVTLDPFDSELSEEIDITFVPPQADLMRELKPGQPLPDFYQPGPDEDEPDEMRNGAIDLGALTLEFFVLALDPYPRKPGVAFDRPLEDTDENVSPFAKLAALKRGEAD